MAAVWTIRASATEVTVGAGHESGFAFEVTNLADTAGYATVDVLLSAHASPAWFRIIQPHQRVAARGTQAFTLEIGVPAHAPAGRHWVQGRVHSTDLGLAGGSATSGQTVVSVSSEPVALAVMVEVPDVRNLPMFDAIRRVTEASLQADVYGTTGEGLYDSAGGNVIFPPGDWRVESQSPAPSTEVLAGSMVTLRVRDHAWPGPLVDGLEINVIFKPRPPGNEPFPLG